MHLSNFQNLRYTFQFSKVLQNYPKFTAAIMKMVCRHENKFKHPSFCDQNFEHCVFMFHMLQKWYFSRSVFVFSSQWPNSSGPCALRLEILASGRLFGVNVTLELYQSLKKQVQKLVLQLYDALAVNSCLCLCICLCFCPCNSAATFYFLKVSSCHHLIQIVHQTHTTFEFAYLQFGIWTPSRLCTHLILSHFATGHK